MIVMNVVAVVVVMKEVVGVLESIVVGGGGGGVGIAMFSMKAWKGIRRVVKRMAVTVLLLGHMAR